MLNQVQYDKKNLDVIPNSFRNLCTWLFSW